MIYAYEDKYDPNLKGLLKVGYTMVGAQSDRGEKTAERFGSFVRIHYLCTIICVTNKFEIMENNIQKEDLLALVKSKIYTIRGQKVMLDFDLAQMYEVETRVLNQSVKRNIERFPDDFMFQLTKGELDILKSQFVTSKMTEIQVDENLKSQNATSNIHESESVGALTSQNVILKNRRGQHSKYLPYAFTEQGVGPKASAWQNSSNSTRSSRNKKFG